MTDSNSAPTPWGEWPSPITVAMAATGAVRLRFPALVGDSEGLDVCWSEARSEEGGRQAVVSAKHGTLLPAPWNARTRVHEYGGQCWLAVPRPGSAPALVFAEWSDQRLYLLEPGDPIPRPLTPEPDIDAGLRYADLTLSPDGAEVWCVREEHAGDGSGGTVQRAIVAVRLDYSQQVRVVVAGSDFLAFPRISPDGRRLAWMAWDHPHMPWDSSRILVGDIVGDLDGAVVTTSRVLLGGDGESVLQPEWGGPGALYAISDRSGWWNLYRLPLDGDAPVALCPRAEEFGEALWQIGQSTYGVLDDGRLAVTHGSGRQSLGILDPHAGTLTDLDLPWTEWPPYLTASGSTVLGIAGGPTDASVLVRVDLDGVAPTPSVIRRSLSMAVDERYLPEVSHQVLPGPHGREVHAQVYAPRNPDVTPPDSPAPYVAFVHGGPTARSSTILNLEIAFFTSRGIGVVDVDYGGSTGYGRAYRERLRGQWGVVDVEDAAAAAVALADRGVADRARLAIRGGSAGGWTTLAALTSTDVFAAGTSYFGVAELLHFVADTHDFESRYVDGLVGPLPESRDLYVERAPLSHVDRLSCPVLLLQGLEDAIVPPSQAEMFRDALARKGIPHAYLAFEGEQHGFRKAETIIACLKAELSFYGQVFGFTPPGVPVLPLVTS